MLVRVARAKIGVVQQFTDAPGEFIHDPLSVLAFQHRRSLIDELRRHPDQRKGLRSRTPAGRQHPIQHPTKLPDRHIPARQRVTVQVVLQVLPQHRARARRQPQWRDDSNIQRIGCRDGIAVQTAREHRCLYENVMAIRAGVLHEWSVIVHTDVAQPRMALRADQRALLLKVRLRRHVPTGKAVQRHRALDLNAPAMWTDVEVVRMGAAALTAMPRTVNRCVGFETTSTLQRLHQLCRLILVRTQRFHQRIAVQQPTVAVAQRLQTGAIPQIQKVKHALFKIQPIRPVRQGGARARHTLGPLARIGKRLPPVRQLRQSGPRRAFIECNPRWPEHRGADLPQQCVLSGGVGRRQMKTRRLHATGEKVRPRCKLPLGPGGQRRQRHARRAGRDT